MQTRPSRTPSRPSPAQTRASLRVGPTGRLSLTQPRPSLTRTGGGGRGGGGSARRGTVEATARAPQVRHTITGLQHTTTILLLLYSYYYTTTILHVYYYDTTTILLLSYSYTTSILLLYDFYTTSLRVPPHLSLFARCLVARGKGAEETPAVAAAVPAAREEEAEPEAAGHALDAAAVQALAPPGGALELFRPCFHF